MARENLGNLFVRLGVDAKAFNKGMKDAGLQVSKIDKNTKRLGSSLRGLKTIAVGAFVGWGVSRVAGSFLDAAKATEGYKTRLNALLGSQVEGNRLFKEMADYAGRVPFEYNAIMESATALAGVMEGGVDEIKRWMPMIGDLAAVSGLSIQETTQQVIRMYSAGAGAADLFRERGVLAMMGFQAGATHSVEETRRKMFEAWNATDSKFKGVTAELAKDWTGMMSMFSDVWFQFRDAVMASGPFQTMKQVAEETLDSITRLKEEGRLDEWAKEMGQGILTGMKVVIYAVALLADGFKGLKMIWAGLQAAFNTWAAAMATGIWALIGLMEKAATAMGFEGVAEKLRPVMDELTIMQQGFIEGTKESITTIKELGRDSETNYGLAKRKVEEWTKAFEKTTEETKTLSQQTKSMGYEISTEYDQLTGQAYTYVKAIGEAKDITTIATQDMSVGYDAVTGQVISTNSAVSDVVETTKKATEVTKGFADIHAITNDAIEQDIDASIAALNKQIEKYEKSGKAVIDFKNVHRESYDAIEEDINKSLEVLDKQLYKQKEVSAARPVVHIDADTGEGPEPFQQGMNSVMNKHREAVNFMNSMKARINIDTNEAQNRLDALGRKAGKVMKMVSRLGGGTIEYLPGRTWTKGAAQGYGPNFARAAGIRLEREIYYQRQRADKLVGRGPSQDYYDWAKTWGYQHGTGPQGLPYTGLFFGHKGEIVTSEQESKKIRETGGGGVTVNFQPMFMTGDRTAGKAAADELWKELKYKMRRG